MTIDSKVPALIPVVEAIVRDMERHLKSEDADKMSMPAILSMFDLSDDLTTINGSDMTDVSRFLTNPLTEMVLHSVMDKTVSGDDDVPTNAYVFAHEAWGSKRSASNPKLGMSINDDPDRKEVFRVEVRTTSGIREQFMYVIDRATKTMELSDVNVAVQVPIGYSAAQGVPEGATVH